MKTRQQIVDAIHQVLALRMAHSHLGAFHSDARLREDLALDSSATLKLLVHLELEHGLALPETALMNQELDTVRALARVLYDAQPRAKSGKVLEYEEDIKLHCFVSCLAEVVKRQLGLDHRVLYFGVWDAEVVVSDRCEISYHSPTISHDAFATWFGRLFGVQVRAWYEPSSTKEENARTLMQLVESRTPDQHIMVMLDLYLLPERVNEFNKDPFPHYLMLGPTHDPESWMMYDPDYRWEGVAARSRILAAVKRPTVAGGYVLSDKGIAAPSPKHIKAYFEASFGPTNELTSAIRRIVTAHLHGRDEQGRELPLEHLAIALDEVPILSIRKYAYEHGLAFFWRELALDEGEFDTWCEVIAELVKTYKVVQFQALKIGSTGNRELFSKLFDLLDQQDQRENLIKQRLGELFRRWCALAFATGAPHAAPRAQAGAAS